MFIWLSFLFYFWAPESLFEGKNSVNVVIPNWKEIGHAHTRVYVCVFKVFPM